MSFPRMTVAVSCALFLSAALAQAADPSCTAELFKVHHDSREGETLESIAKVSPLRSGSNWLWTAAFTDLYARIILVNVDQISAEKQAVQFHLQLETDAGYDDPQYTDLTAPEWVSAERPLTDDLALGNRDLDGKRLIVSCQAN